MHVGLFHPIKSHMYTGALDLHGPMSVYILKYDNKLYHISRMNLSD